MSSQNMPSSNKETNMQAKARIDMDKEIEVESRINALRFQTYPTDIFTPFDMCTVDYCAKIHDIDIDSYAIDVDIGCLTKLEKYCVMVSHNNDLPYTSDRLYMTIVIESVFGVVFPCHQFTPLSKKSLIENIINRTMFPYGSMRKNVNTYFEICTISRFDKKYEKNMDNYAISTLQNFCTTIALNNKWIPYNGSEYPLSLIEIVYSMVFSNGYRDLFLSKEQSKLLLEQKINELRYSFVPSGDMTTVDGFNDKYNLNMGIATILTIEGYCTQVCKNNLGLPYIHRDNYPMVVVVDVYSIMFPKKASSIQTAIKFNPDRCYVIR